MIRTRDAVTEGLVPVGARPCAAMHGYGWQAVQAKRGFNSTTTGNARRLPGAPT